MWSGRSYELSNDGSVIVMPGIQAIAAAAANPPPVYFSYQRRELEAPPAHWRAVARPVMQRTSQGHDEGGATNVGSFFPQKHQHQEQIAGEALYEDEERTPVICLPPLSDENWCATSRSGLLSSAALYHEKVQAPPIVQSVGNENGRHSTLHALPLSLRVKSPVVTTPQAWRSKPDITPVPMRLPSNLFLPSLAYDGDDEDNDGDDDDDDDELISTFPKTRDIQNSGIVRVVSYDEADLDDGHVSLGRHIDNLGEGGDIELKELVASAKELETQNGAVVIRAPGRKAPPPRRLDYANVVRSNLPMTLLDAIPPTEKFPTSCSEFAVLIGKTIEKGEGEQGAQKAECILRHMTNEYKSGRTKFRPDGGMYNKVMHAYAMQGNAFKVEELLQVMCSDFKKGDHLAMPNFKHYTTLLLAWQTSNDSQAPVRCEEIVAEMHRLHDKGSLPECKPDTHTYTTVLHCWANSLREDSAVRAEALFRQMKIRHEQGDASLRPDYVIYSNLMNAISKSGGFARAEAILWEMVDEYLKGNESCKPRIRNLNTILAVWSKSTVPHAPLRAEELVRRWLRLNQTERLGVKPDEYTYCLLLKCW